MDVDYLVMWQVTGGCAADWMLLANWGTSSSRRGQGKEGGAAGLGETRILQPLGDADDIQGGSSDNMLEPSLGQADIASTAQITDPQSLGERALNASSDVIPCAEQNP